MNICTDKIENMEMILNIEKCKIMRMNNKIPNKTIIVIKIQTVYKYSGSIVRMRTEI